MNGILYVCGTPIGNLEDVSFRLLRILSEADLIAAEDTRHTQKLLNKYEIKTKATSYHEFNKKEKGPRLIKEILEGKNIALVTDAGMPGISDPGSDLIRLCHENKIKVTAVPGPTAVITALVLSGLDTSRYIFEGFLPMDKKERKNILSGIEKEERTVVIYEAPHKLKKTLRDLADITENRKISLIREITKQYEEILQNTAAGLLEIFEEREPLGEMVLVIEGLKKGSLEKAEREKWLELSVEEHMAIYGDIPKKEAMKKVAADRGISKREIYKKLLE